jgi:hypothetical protein
VITGADAAAGTATSTTGTFDRPPLTASGESTTGATESTEESDDPDGDRSTGPAFTAAASTTPDTTEFGRG